MRVGLWLLAFVSFSLHAQTLDVLSSKKHASFTLNQLKAKLKVQTVEIDDPVYERKMTYDGFALADVLQLAEANADDKANEIVFTALDGYSPNMSYAQLKALKGYLVFQEHGRKGFMMVNQGKTRLSPGPFYVVWQSENGEKPPAEVPWPYQLAKIEVVNWALKYPRVVPPKAAPDSPEMKGFVIFKSECIRCHSINLQGGDVGPELGAPQNVTEYWKPEVLKAFVHDAPSFRYKSKMPSFKAMPEEQLAQVLAYLAYMKDFKITADKF